MATVVEQMLFVSCHSGGTVPVARIYFPRRRFRDGFGIGEKKRTDDAE